MLVLRTPIQAPQALRLRHEGVEADRISAPHLQCAASPVVGTTTNAQRCFSRLKAKHVARWCGRRRPQRGGVFRGVVWLGIKGARHHPYTRPIPCPSQVGLPGGFNFGTLSAFRKFHLEIMVLHVEAQKRTFSKLFRCKFRIDFEENLKNANFCHFGGGPKHEYR